MRTLFLSLWTIFSINIVFGQKEQEIKWNVNINDVGKYTKSLDLKDLRENKEIGYLLKSTGDSVKVKFKNSPEQDIRDWFNRCPLS